MTDIHLSIYDGPACHGITHLMEIYTNEIHWKSEYNCSPYVDAAGTRLTNAGYSLKLTLVSTFGRRFLLVLE